MCVNDEQQMTWRDFEALLRGEGLSPFHGQGQYDLPARASVGIMDTQAIGVLAEPGVVQLRPMTWSFEPLKPAYGPLYNVKSDGRALGEKLPFGATGRCLIPVSAFFEFKGDGTPKSRFRITMADRPAFCIAGLWKQGHGNLPDRFTMLTTPPGVDIQPYHHRQAAVLRPGTLKAWLDLSAPEAELLAPSPAGLLQIAPTTPLPPRPRQAA